MKSFSDLKDKVLGLDHLNIDDIQGFMNDMSTARTSAYYSDEKQAEYRALNIENVSTFFEDNRVGGASSIRIALVTDRIKAAHNLQTDMYF